MLSLIFLSFLSTATADDNDTTPEVVYKKETTIDFEGVDVTGDLVKPQGSLVVERRSAGFNPMIKLRADFNPEMSESINNVK